MNHGKSCDGNRNGNDIRKKLKLAEEESIECF